MRVILVDDEMITRISLKNFICSQLPQYEVAGTFANGRMPGILCRHIRLTSSSRISVCP